MFLRHNEGVYIMPIALHVDNLPLAGNSERGIKEMKNGLWDVWGKRSQIGKALPRAADLSVATRMWTKTQSNETYHDIFTEYQVEYSPPEWIGREDSKVQERGLVEDHLTSSKR